MVYGPYLRQESLEMITVCDIIFRLNNMEAVAQWQSATLWMWMLRVRNRPASPKKAQEGLLFF